LLKFTDTVLRLIALKTGETVYIKPRKPAWLQGLRGSYRPIVVIQVIITGRFHKVRKYKLIISYGFLRFLLNLQHFMRKPQARRSLEYDRS
jgi:hypothetical protein